MANFLVRITLHHAKLWDDYKPLHGVVEQNGFRRTVVDDKGVEFFLPPGEYIGSSEMTAAQVCETAKRIANSVWANSSVLVVEAGVWSSVGLEPVKAPA